MSIITTTRSVYILLLVVITRTLLQPQQYNYCILPVVNALPPPQDERYSFSLTTFDPNGRLGQVERAQQAALLGTPIIALSLTSSSSSLSKQNEQNSQQQRMIVLVAPQVLQNNILMIDDGTTRFVQLTNEIIISHSGISADGRILISAAQRIAIEHEYTFQEEITCNTLLNKLSLLIQDYTMKPGTRPFGSSLILVYLPKYSIDIPRIYRIDVSGQIQLVVNNNIDCTIIHGNNNNFIQRTGLQEKLNEFLDETKQKSYYLDEDMIQNKIVELVRDALLHHDDEYDNTNKGNNNKLEENTSKRNNAGDENDNNSNNNNNQDEDEDDDNNNSIIDELLLRQTRPSAILTACLSSSSSLSGNTFTRKRHQL